MLTRKCVCRVDGGTDFFVYTCKIVQVVLEEVQPTEALASPLPAPVDDTAIKAPAELSPAELPPVRLPQGMRNRNCQKSALQ